MLTAWFGAAEESVRAVVVAAADVVVVVVVTVAAHVEPVAVEPSTVVVVVEVLLFPLAAVESASAKKSAKAFSYLKLEKKVLEFLRPPVSYSGES